MAALTMPSLVASYQEKVVVTKLKKAYSAMSQAYAQAVEEYGTPDNWELVGNQSVADSQKIIAKFTPYLKSSPGKTDSSIYLADGQSIEFSSRSANCTSNRGPGSLANTCALFTVTLDPKNSVQGVNSFHMNITKNGIVPHGTQDDTSFGFDDCCLKLCGNPPSKWGCTAWVIFNENMDYLHCDDLSWGGKTKCD